MGNIGEDHDVVSLVLNDEVIIRSTQFDVQQAVTTQPNAFAMDIGTGEEARRLIKRFPPGTPFSLAVDGARQFTGVTDGYTTQQSGSATSFGLRGRDSMAFLLGNRATEDRSFTDVTYAELTQQILTLALPAGRDFNLAFSNAANRAVVTKAPPAPTVQFDAVDEVLGLLGLGPDEPSQSAQQSRKLRVKAGQDWYGWLKGELDRAGLMLWADAFGDFVLSAPDTQQPPMARIHRKRGTPSSLVDVLEASHRNEMTNRFSECVVHMRRGGGAEPRAKGFGSFVDEEMKRLGFDRRMVITDTKCKTLAQAEAMARRKVAESRRQGWSLQYSLAGFTTIGTAGTRVVWAPDTVVEVDDDELDLRGSFWVESVRRARSPQSRTDLTLMRLEDVVYGADPDGEE